MQVGIEDPALFNILLQILAQGGIAVMPCDTIYGIVGPAPDSEKRIKALKGREEKKAFIHLIASYAMMSEFTDLALPDALKDYWPGPLTLIFPAKKGGAVALRLPEDHLLRKIMQEMEKPLFSTSVNLSGEDPLWRIQDILFSFKDKVDLIVDAGDLPGRKPSTILDITTRPFRLVRQGVLKLPGALLE